MAACATHATAKPAMAVDSSAVDCASQIRTSTVPKEWCGRMLHHSCVDSTTDPVRTRKSTCDAYAVQLPQSSGIPERGKLFVKICVRAEWRPESVPSRNGELAETAS